MPVIKGATVGEHPRRSIERDADGECRAVYSHAELAASGNDAETT